MSHLANPSSSPPSSSSSSSSSPHRLIKSRPHCDFPAQSVNFKSPRPPRASVWMTPVRVLSAQSRWSSCRRLLAKRGEAHPSIRPSFSLPSSFVPATSTVIPVFLGSQISVMAKLLLALPPQFASLHYIHMHHHLLPPMCLCY